MKITCRNNLFVSVCIIVLALFMSACGGGDGDTPSTTTSTPPATAIKTTIDEQNRVTAVIPPTGGTITTTGQDGTIYTLTFPAGSTAAEIQVSLAPVLSITGLVFDPGFVAAVDMAPDGHQFQSPVTLTIELQSPLAGTGFPMGIHVASNGVDSTLLPTQVNGNLYSIEFDHFSAAGLWEVTEESAHQYILDKYYGPLGLVETLNDITKCSDYRFDLLIIKVVDLYKTIELVDGFIYIEEETINPPKQCTGYVGFPSECSSLDQLRVAAMQNLDDALVYFTNEAIQQCSAGDPAQEVEAFECARKGLRVEESGLAVREGLNDALCGIKANCGIASLEVQPMSLKLNVSESQQLTAIPRDLAGNVLNERDLQWQNDYSHIVKLSGTEISNPYVTGISPGRAAPFVVDLMGEEACWIFTHADAPINVTNQFVTSVESIIVPEGETAVLKVKLGYPPEIGVEGTISRASGDADLTLASGEVLTFKPDDWDVFQSVILFAFEDDGDIENGTAVFEITDTSFDVTGNAVPTKEILAQELDNDGPAMFVTPDLLCVEVGQTANLSVIGNEYVDLGAITWSSSDIGVSTVNATGIVDAVGQGPARITASMIVDSQVVASAFATIRVQDQCVTIRSTDTPAHSCIVTASNPAFETGENSIQLEATINTLQDGYALTWDTTNSSVITVAPNTGLTGTVTGVSGGIATVELTVNNIVTQYHATLPVTVASLPEEYKAAWLTLPYNTAEPPVLTNKREVLSYGKLSQIVLTAIQRCNINVDALPGIGWEFNNLNENGQYIGNYFDDISLDFKGFVFDAKTCSLNYLDAPMKSPRGGIDNEADTYPMDINDQGTIVGQVHWAAFDDNWCEISPDYDCQYKLNTAFILENGIYSFPFYDSNSLPYSEYYPNVSTSLFGINNNRVALFSAVIGSGGFSELEGEGYYYLDFPVGETNPVQLNILGASSLNDFEHIVGTDVTPWIFSDGLYSNLNPVFSNGNAPSIIFADQINNSNDILARGVNAGETFKHFLMYLCPLPIESSTAQWFEDRSLLEGYETPEVSCDGRDNDLDGFFDVQLDAPLTTKQAGVCAGVMKVCTGAQGWVDDYSSIPDYEFPEVSCDNKDNDCDGIKDEGCPI